jgi:pimeloyl-ACP methyl ester carboxylesterase
MDLRGHGRSDDASWSVEAALSDIEAVLAHFGATDAALVGHSLGGLLAVAYAAAHAETPAVVNIDGYNALDPSLHPELDDEQLSERVSQLRQLQDARVAADLTQEQVEMRVTAAAARLRDEPTARAAVLRCLERRPDGRYARRPDPETKRAIRDTIARLDVFALYARLGCPLLVACATEPDPAPPQLPWFADAQAVVLDTLRDRLAELRRERCMVDVVFVAATHADILLDVRLHEKIAGFLGGC